MTEFNFTRGTKILTLATSTLFISWTTTFFYYPRSLGNIFTLISTFFSAIATYAAASDMDMPLFLSQYFAATLGKTSAALTWSLVASGLVVLDVLVWTVINFQVRLNLMDTIALILAIIGGIFVLCGGLLAHKEWNMQMNN